ncbi:MAG: hypothetical protein GY716_07690 [bacterium]|nr:hypothetical protein [bacterium]
MSDPIGPEPFMFITGMINGVGATPSRCDSVVEGNATARRMTAMCATFDGSFEDFEARWALYMLSDAYRRNNGKSYNLPHSEPQTAWEERGDIHERIYAVGESVVGVRFYLGEIIMVHT